MMENLVAKISNCPINGEPLVTIITPTYNHEKYIEKCIESVLSQTYTNWEMIIVNDGSTDRTEEKIFNIKDKRLRYIKKTNGGIWKLNEVYNLALKLSKGKYIAVLEGDDYWPSTKLEKQLQLFNDKEVVLCWGKTEIVDASGNHMRYHPKEKYFKLDSDYQKIRELLLFNYIPACTVMIKTDALNSIGGFIQYHNTPYVDYPTWLKLSLKGKFASSSEILGIWRWHSAQATKNLKVELTKGTIISISYYDNLPIDFKEKLSISREDIEQNYLNRLEKSKIYSAIFYISEHDWVKAKDKINSVQYRNLKIFIMTVGILIYYYIMKVVCRLKIVEKLDS
ncbi:glycosyltransferase family 2 protein [Methanogenium organophilum]|uniref:Glycosyltransferase n=1 Tax=Methanogenium organophilum TaxID=2199 RepID=A0A9X9S2T3_METOG|nr:glycosyltransferase [Methanogenium organophilum]WAI00844.1 glycosyltransferase [Methanogenium organophilum]